MDIPKLQLNDRHKFVRQLRKYLNELVQPSPNLPDDDLVDDKTLAAVYAFKNQCIQKVASTQYERDHRYEITSGLWAMIGRALGKDRLLKDLRETTDNEIRSLLLGMDNVNNISSFYTAEMEKCDMKIAAILGGKNAVAAANGFEPDSLVIVRQAGVGRAGQYDYYRGDVFQQQKDGTRVLGQGHLSRYIMHLYGSIDGTRFGVDGKTETDIYIPDGFEMKSNVNWDGKLKKNALTQIPTPTQAVVTFYYKQLGNIKNATLLLMHVKNFKPKKDGNRWYVGGIGGIGGKIGDITKPYLHSHFVLLKGDVGLARKGDERTVNAVAEYQASIGIRFAEASC